VLDRFSPILHLVQSIRDEAHRFAVTFHRTRRNARALTSELDQIEGVGELAGVIGRGAARRVRRYYEKPSEATEPAGSVPR
jgi:excinuclease ABC subunit C